MNTLIINGRRRGADRLIILSAAKLLRACLNNGLVMAEAGAYLVNVSVAATLFMVVFLQWHDPFLCAT